MSKGNPTLAEFLAGFQILVPQAHSGRLVSYRYSVALKRLYFRLPDGSAHKSKGEYSVADITELYHQITPKKRAVACR